ncbi:MAG: thioredoxin-disulfide reductase [Opitutales bacterium]|nr:thioredoxin-disulfide reductase [Opitutales bacterium]
MENLVIIGSGCAGATAAIYAARAGFSPLVLEGNVPGGQITTTSVVENFPGFPDGVDGFSLTYSMHQQAEKFGARFEFDAVDSVDFSGTVKKLNLISGKTLEAKAVIVATGATPRFLGVPGEKEFFGGNGVSTCATCDGAFYKDKEIAVIGGGDTAAEEAQFLTRFASKVYLVHRRDKLRASEIMVSRVMNNPKIVPVLNAVVERILGGDNGKVRALVVKDKLSGEEREIALSGIFVAIGHEPDTKFLKGALPMDDDGTLRTEGETGVKTAIPGVFVAGDCADRHYRQAITAAGTGARAGIEAGRFLEG